uniref:Uncharacterized protein n=1 Tax=Rhizophora mucronata TaxID=61149 RepID=A0A2P2MML2_RHIMU
MRGRQNGDDNHRKRK